MLTLLPYYCYLICEYKSYLFFVRRRHPRPRLGMQGRHLGAGMALSAPQGQTLSGTVCPKPRRSLLLASVAAIYIWVSGVSGYEGILEGMLCTRLLM